MCTAIVALCGAGGQGASASGIPHRTIPMARPALVGPHAVRTLVVKTTADTPPPCKPSAFSLRCAVDQANKDGSGDTIAFSIPSSDRGCKTQTIHGSAVAVCTIKAIVNDKQDCCFALFASDTIIDGYTQPGARRNTSPMGSGAGDNAILTIDVDGSSLSVGRTALDLVGPRETVTGLAITNFRTGFDGIDVFNSNDKIWGDFLGIGPDGRPQPNDIGLFLAGNPQSQVRGTQIGGNVPSTANVISANTLSILVNSGLSGGGTVVQGNYINTTVDGAGALVGGVGLDIASTRGVQVGGMTSDQRNVILGTLEVGDSEQVSVQGNYIGTDVKGQKALNTGSSGVAVGGPQSSQILIGGTAAGAGNLISGNTGAAVSLTNDSIGTIVQANLIGTDATGRRAVPNGIGVSILDSDGNVVGGTTPAVRNVISGNTSAGVLIDDGVGNLIQGNFIGTDLSGTMALGNGKDGTAAVNLVTEDFRNSDNHIGGAAAGAGNVISGNLADGVDLSSIESALTPRNTVEANIIGMTAGAKRPLGNARNGVFVADNVNGASIGNPAGPGGNLIAFNRMSGVLVGLSAANTRVHVAINRNTMARNGGLGIDLGPQGVVNCASTPPGPNDYTPCPVIRTASTQQASGSACGGCLVEVFVATNEPDDLRHGEGQAFRGRAVAGSNGLWTVLLAPGVSVGQQLTATATRPATSANPPSSSRGAETSEFAANVAVH